VPKTPDPRLLINALLVKPDITSLLYDMMVERLKAPLDLTQGKPPLSTGIST
jgi:hypothetical protein